MPVTTVPTESATIVDVFMVKSLRREPRKRGGVKGEKGQNSLSRRRCNIQL
jgi:hypothetical protein